MSTPPNRKEKSSLFVLAMALPFPVLFLLAGAGSAASPRAASLPLLVAALFLAALSSLSLALAIRLRQSREQIRTAQQLLSAQSDFLARMSHDMRTPLNAIVGLTALAQDEPGNPTATGAYLSQIASSAKYLQSLAGDVLDISRIECGELELHPAPYPLSEFEEAVRALALSGGELAALGLGLEDKLDVKMGALSGGQRQAVALLMATMTPLKFLILDEHTAALDPKTAAKVLEISNKIVQENHLTTLMITHNMRDAIRYGNRLIMMNEGHVIYDVRGEEKTKLEVSDLLQRFEQAGGEANDRMILS